jgi:hypothetical protein
MSDAGTANGPPIDVGGLFGGSRHATVRRTSTLPRVALE